MAIVHKILVILRSCLTGQAVWIYRGPSKHAAWKAYWRACRGELEYVRSAGPAARARRKANIRRLLSDCMESLPVTGEMTPEQKTAARRLVTYSERPAVPAREFYDHIVEERRRRAADLKMIRKMRMRDSSKNPCYDKQEGKG